MVVAGDLEDASRVHLEYSASGTLLEPFQNDSICLIVAAAKAPQFTLDGTRCGQSLWNLSINYTRPIGGFVTSIYRGPHGKFPPQRDYKRFILVVLMGTTRSTDPTSRPAMCFRLRLTSCGMIRMLSIVEDINSLTGLCLWRNMLTVARGPRRICLEPSKCWVRSPIKTIQEPWTACLPLVKHKNAAWAWRCSRPPWLSTIVGVHKSMYTVNHSDGRIQISKSMRCALPFGADSAQISTSRRKL